MTWRTATVPTDRLAALLASIRSDGGTVTSSHPDCGQVCVIWTTVDGRTAFPA